MQNKKNLNVGGFKNDMHGFLGGFKSERALVGSNNNIRKTFSLVGKRALGD